MCKEPVYKEPVYKEPVYKEPVLIKCVCLRQPAGRVAEVLSGTFSRACHRVSPLPSLCGLSKESWSLEPMMGTLPGPSRLLV